MSLSRFIPDKYQKAIREAFTNTEHHLFINARAGSGKTTTLTYLMNYIPKEASAVSMAFSKRVQMELQNRIPKNVGSMTLHSYGFTCLRSNGIEKLEKWKVGKIIRDLGYKKDVTQALKDLTSLQKNTLNSDINYLIDTYHIDLPKKTSIEQVGDWVKKILEEDVRLAREEGICDYDDQLWLPIHLDLNLSVYDVIFVDETQDLNPTQIRLIQQATRNNGRVICVGDKNQSCYQFRGADPQSIETLLAYLTKTPRGVQSLPLSISYRCSRKVIEAAQDLVPGIEAAPNAPEGSVTRKKVEQLKHAIMKMRPAHLQLGENKMRKFMILSRTNAPLMPWYLLLQRLKLPVSFRSNLMASQLQELLARCSNYRKSTILETCQNLRSHADQVMALMKDGLARENFSDKIHTLIDFVGNVPQTASTLEAHYQELDTLLEERFAATDIDASHDTILLATVHCAKGLEAENVFLIRPDLLPHPSAQKPMEKVQEDNIKYIAITRAAKHLYFIDGKDEV